MRRLVLFVLIAGFVLSNVVGCIMVLDVKGTPYHKQVVVVDGELYVVDVKSHRLRKIDESWEIQTETTVETEIEDSR